MAEISEERFLKGFPMFQGEVREILIKTVNDDIHDVQSLFQLLDPFFSVTLLKIQEWLVVTSLFPDVIGGVVFPKELLRHLVVLSNSGWGVVQVLLDIVGSGDLIGGGGDEGGGSSVERHSNRRLPVREESVV
jgi:hypothetical protein